MKRSAIFFAFLAFFSVLVGEDPKLDKLLKDFDQYAQNSLSAWKVPGMAIAIVKEGQIIYSKGFGDRELDQEGKVDAHTLFQIGSISKSFTTALLAMSVDDGLIKWNQQVVDILPGFMMYDPWVTREFQIEDLVCQRSGLPENAGDYYAYLGANKSDMIHALRFLKPVSSFRSQYAYQNALFVVAGEVLEKKTNTSFGSLIKQKIFNPLGMNESSTDFETYLKTENSAGFHTWSPTKLEKHVRNSSNNSLFSTLFLAAGGINSTVTDMAKWLILMINQGHFEGKQLIKADNAAKLVRPHIYMMKLYGSDLFYCLGWVKNDYLPYSFTWHSGGTDGAGSMAGFISEEKLGIVILTNANRSNLPSAMMRQFFDMYFEKPNHDWSARMLSEAQKITPETPVLKNPFPPMPLEKYTGIYHNALYGEAVVTVEKENLTLTLKSRTELKFILKPWDRDIFEVRWSPEGSSNPKAYFCLNSDEHPSSVTIDVLEKMGTGTFLYQESK